MTEIQGVLEDLPEVDTLWWEPVAETAESHIRGAVLRCVGWDALTEMQTYVLNPVEHRVYYSSYLIIDNCLELHMKEIFANL